MKNWNEYYETELIEFILPAENIEIIQKINIKYKEHLSIDLNLNYYFRISK